jgi:hypothetical protein
MYFVDSLLVGKFSKFTRSLLDLPEDPVFSTSRQKARLEKKLLPDKAFIGSISFGKSFFSSRALCPEVLKTGSSGIY